ncbi:hypothetical protein [Bosea sp. BIWAKO-01]|uniref:DUF6894 family protein n=1 Tax=Bosea sp. BIWAKO-01 TaxID=506668 RepID=UPI00085357AD|nr:hypothetical protein [Bosea sp. BIWAKO-01]
MAQYFFDIEINTELVVDDEGIDLEDHVAARLSALSSLGDIIAEHIQTSDDLRVDMRIRYADGTPIFAAKLTLNSQWLTPVPPSQLRQMVPRKTEP